MSFKSLVNKLVKEGKSREAATKIAGKVANAKMKGAGSGPTAKQKARMKGSPAKNNDNGAKETKAQTRARYKKNKSKRRAAKKDIRKGTYPENAAVKAGIALDSTKGSNYDQVLSSRATAKNKAKQEGTTVRKSKKNFVKSFNEQNKNTGNKEKLKLTVFGKIKTTPTKMKKQGYNARLDDSLGAKHGKKSQSLKSRRDESEGMEKSMGKRKFSGNKSSAQGSPAKFQAYDQMDTWDAGQTAGSPMGMYGSNSPANMSGQSYDAKEAYNKDLSASARLHYLDRGNPFYVLGIPTTTYSF